MDRVSGAQDVRRRRVAPVTTGRDVRLPDVKRVSSDSGVVEPERPS
jgi:hypothetical protein